MSVGLVRRQFTVEEYHQMRESGILKESDRVELIEGEIVEMSPVGRRHAAHVKRLNKLFSQRLGDRALIGVQDPVELSDRSEPQPDIALLRPREDFYESGHPQPADIFLLVEVSDTTAEIDRAVKVPTYARSNISEVWLIDISEQSIEVYREPSAEGYQYFQKFQRGQTIFPLNFPDIQLTVNEMLG